MSPFTIGESVALNGLLGELHGATTGTVVSVVPNEHGITTLDEYEVVFDDSQQLRFSRFQLTHVVHFKEHENASLC